MSVESRRSGARRRGSRLLVGALFGSVALSALPAWAQTNELDGRGASLRARRSQVEELQLDVGEQRVVPSDGVRSYSEGTQGVVDVRLTKDASQFVIVGMREGTTTVLFLLMDGTERHLKITVGDPRVAGKKSGEISVEARDNVRLDFYFVQVSKTYGHQLGLGWPQSIAAPRLSASYDLQTGTLDRATAVVSNQALPRIDLGEVAGWAKILRQAAVVTANGEKATFSGGGEVNVLVQSAVTTGIQRIAFGSEVEVEPLYDSKTGRIELRLHADLAELESDRGTGVPGRTTSTLDTIVNLELGQSLVLAGLSGRSERRSTSGLPVLSRIPILGLFFGSQTRAEDEVENVIVIVPSVVDAVSRQDKARLEAALRAYDDYSGNMSRAEVFPDPPASAPGARGGAE